LQDPAGRYREFAERVIARVHCMEEATVTLGELPAELAAEVPLPANAVVVGTVTHRRAGKRLRADAYLDVTGVAREVMRFYEDGLRSRGWKLAPPQPPGMHGGFVATPPGFGHTRTFVRGKSGPFMGVSIKAGHTQTHDVTVHWDAGTEGPHPGASQRMPGGRLMAGELVPPLLPPDGVEVLPGGSGGSDAEWRTEADAFSDVSTAELERHYAQQLARVGWREQEAGAEGPLAWSRWRLAADDYEALLVVLKLPLPSRRLLALRVESPRRREQIWSRMSMRSIGP